MATIRDLSQSLALIVFSIAEFVTAKSSQRLLLFSNVVFQVYFNGVKALFPVIIVGFAIGVVVSFVISMVMSGPLELLVGQIQAGVIVFLIAKLFGPILVMFVIVARSGSAMCIELGYMKVQSELDALVSMGVSPLQFIIAPRIIGMVLSFLVLNYIGITSGIIGSVSIGLILTNESFERFLEVYFESLFNFLHPRDVLITGLYALGFGTLIPGITCYYGMSVKQSLSELPELTTRGIVSAMISCILYYTYVTVIILMIKDVDYWIGFKLPF